MPVQRSAEDWTAEEVRRLWGWISSRREMIRTYFSRHKGRALRNFLKATGRLRGRVLDFGCGPGFLLLRLCRVGGVEGYGLDFSPKNAEVTRERLEGNPNFKGATVVDGLPSPLTEQSFDLITCVEVVEHLTDGQCKETIGEIYRLLKPGGYAFFTTPNEEDLSRAQNYCPFCDSQYHKWQHLRSFTADELGALLAGAGFEVSFCQGIDLSRFQPPEKRGILDMGAAYVGGKVWRAVRDSTAYLLDLMLRKSFPRNFRFRSKVRPGRNLVAFVRRPS